MNSQEIHRKTVLITGSSTGIGRSTAILFATRGWNVIATMRNPEKEKGFAKYSNILVEKLDVTKIDTIQTAIRIGIERFGQIDVMVNNAGYGLVGPFEGATDDQVEKQFGTNIGGVFACTKAILPHFRANKSGTIINVSSIGGRLTFPYYSLYNSTKWAVDGFSEGLSYELKQFGIRVKIIEPGAIKTDFYNRSPEFTMSEQTIDYQPEFTKIQKEYLKTEARGSSPEMVANIIYKAATDHSSKLRYKAGMDAHILLFLRKVLPERMSIWIMAKVFGI